MYPQPLEAYLDLSTHKKSRPIFYFRYLTCLIQSRSPNTFVKHTCDAPAISKSWRTTINEAIIKVSYPQAMPAPPSRVLSAELIQALSLVSFLTPVFCSYSGVNAATGLPIISFDEISKPYLLTYQS